MTQARNFMLALPSDASDYVKRIGEHFISFIHKLDQAAILNDFDREIALYQKYCDPDVKDHITSCSEFWISQIGNFLASTLSSKYMKITTLSGDGEKQLLVDILYIRKLLS